MSTSTTIDQRLVLEFKEKVYDRAGEIDYGDSEDWHSLALGWALAKALEPEKASDFASHVTYQTDWH